MGRKIGKNKQTQLVCNVIYLHKINFKIKMQNSVDRISYSQKKTVYY